MARALTIGLGLLILLWSMPSQTPVINPISGRFQDSNAAAWQDNFSGENLSAEWSLYANGEAPSSDPWNWTMADSSLNIDSVGEMVAPIEGNLDNFTLRVDLNGSNYHVTFRIGEPGDPWNSTCNIGTWSGPEGDFRLWDDYAEQFISYGDDLSDNHTITIVGADTIIEVYVNDVHIGNGTCSRTAGRIGFGSAQYPNNVNLHHYEFHRETIRPTLLPPRNNSTNNSGDGDNETNPANLTMPAEDNITTSRSTPGWGLQVLLVAAGLMVVVKGSRRRVTISGKW